MLFWSDGDIATCRYFIECESENDQLSAGGGARCEGSSKAHAREHDRLLLHHRVPARLHSRLLRRRRRGAVGGVLRELLELQGRVRRRRRDVVRAGGYEVRSRIAGAFRQNVVTDVLRGVESDTVARFGLQDAATFGALDEPAGMVKEVIELLAASSYLEITEGTYPMVGLGSRAREAARDDSPLDDEARPAREAGREEGKDRLVRFGLVRRPTPFSIVCAPCASASPMKSGVLLTLCSPTPRCAICAPEGP